MAEGSPFGVLPSQKYSLGRVALCYVIIFPQKYAFSCTMGILDLLAWVVCQWCALRREVRYIVAASLGIL